MNNVLRWQQFYYHFYYQNMLKKIKIWVAKKVENIRRSLQLRYCKSCNVSIGENCLTDNILSRYGLKSFSTVYSHCRSNIDYAIALEKESYKNLLEDKFLYYDNSQGNRKVVRNNNYSINDNIFNHMHIKGFEFTHHDILGNIAFRKSMERKRDRLLNYKGKKNFNFFYHYRLNPNISISYILKRAKEFLTYYEKNNKKCRFIIFTQIIIKHKKERRLEKVAYSESIVIYTFYTLDIWGGDDPEILWARNDDDLIKEMLHNL